MATPMIKIDWPQDERDELSRQINRLAVEAGIGIGEAVRWGAWYLAKSLAFGTRKAKKTRNPKINRGAPDYPSDEYPYYMDIWTQRRKTPKPVYIHKSQATTKSEAKRLDIAQIKRRGLCRSAWFWTISDIGRPTGQKRRDAKRHQQTVDRTHDELNPSFEATNRLRYAADALKHKGKYTVGTAAQRASKSMAKAIDRGVYKRWRQ